MDIGYFGLGRGFGGKPGHHSGDEAITAALMKAQIENVIKKLQEHQVEDHWGKAVSDASFHVKVDLTIGPMGPVK